MQVKNKSTYYVAGFWRQLSLFFAQNEFGVIPKPVFLFFLIYIAKSSIETLVCFDGV